MPFTVCFCTINADYCLPNSAYSQFPAMRALSISSADAFILVYDVTDESTFEEARLIRDLIHETKGTTVVPIVVVGNKLDLVEEDETLRQVRVNRYSVSVFYVIALLSVINHKPVTSPHCTFHLVPSCHN